MCVQCDYVVGVNVGMLPSGWAIAACEHPTARAERVPGLTLRRHILHSWDGKFHSYFQKTIRK